MKLETIYEDLLEIMKNDMDFTKALSLKEKLEKAIREESCYKTSNKTRVNAIKRIASKNNVRPVLQGYGIYGDYKVVTDSYHLIAIKEENMPLKLVTTDLELVKKIGKENCISGNYPNMESVLRYNTSNELPMIDLNDLESFVKLHKKDKEVYKIGEQYFNPNYVKNIVDVLGKDLKIYYQGENKPLFFENKKGEIGLVVPIQIKMTLKKKY